LTAVIRPFNITVFDIISFDTLKKCYNNKRFFSFITDLDIYFCHTSFLLVGFLASLPFIYQYWNERVVADNTMERPLAVARSNKK